MAEIRALLPDGTAPSTLKAQIQDEATTAANAVGEQLAEGIGVIAETAVSAAQQATEAKTAVEAVQATLSSETIRIFPTQAEAQAWETEQEGRIGLWVDQGEPLIEITATAPTFDDVSDTYTIPTRTGVRYLVDGTVRTGTIAVGDADTTVTVTAQAEAGYALTGTTSWTGTYTKTPVPTVSVVELAIQDSAAHIVHVKDGTITDAGSTPLSWTPTDVTLTGDRMTFNGSTSQVAAATTTGGLAGGIGAFTILAVATPTASTTGAAALSHSVHSFVPSDATKRVYGVIRGTGPAAIASATNTAPTGERAVFAWRFDTASFSLHRNRALLKTQASAVGALASTGSDPVVIGKSSGATFTGAIEQLVIIRGTALSDARIAAYADAAGIA